MPRTTPWSWTLSKGLLVAGVAGGALGGPGPVAALGAGPCQVTAAAQAEPATLLLGEATEASVALRVSCPERPALPLRIAWVVDSSGSMAGNWHLAQRRALAASVASLDLAAHPGRLGAVVKAGSSAPTVLCRLTNDAGRLQACIKKIDANGGSWAELGIAEAKRTLAAGRPPSGDAAGEIIVLLSDGLGPEPDACTTLIPTAERVKSEGVTLATVALNGVGGREPDVDCLLAAASGPDWFLDVRDPAGLEPALAILTRRVDEAVTRELQLSVRAGPGQALSAAPGSAALATWRWPLVGSELLVARWALRPGGPGDQGAGEAITASLWGTDGTRLDVPIEPPGLHVLGRPIRR